VFAGQSVTRVSLLSQTNFTRDEAKLKSGNKWNEYARIYCRSRTLRHEQALPLYDDDLVPQQVLSVPTVLLSFLQ
jgi:hypothetical protein